MKIAICDDTYQDSGKLEELIYKYFNYNERLFTCDVYTSGEELIENLKKPNIYYQIYFLDIEMLEINGLQAAKFIRSKDMNALIVFTTNHSELVYQAFEVNAFHYLRKPIDKDMVDKILIRAKHFLTIKNTIFQFKSGKILYTLNYNQILYFEKDKRLIFVHTDNENFTYYGTFKELNDNVNDTIFAQIHKSFIINMDFVFKIENKELVLKNNKRISISRKYYNEFMNKYRQFILERLI